MSDEKMGHSFNLPPLATRREVADYCNQSPIRKKKITVRVVKWWQEEGWIKPHPMCKNPVRYSARDILDFLDGRVSIYR